MTCPQLGRAGTCSSLWQVDLLWFGGCGLLPTIHRFQTYSSSLCAVAMSLHLIVVQVEILLCDVALDEHDDLLYFIIPLQELLLEVHEGIGTHQLFLALKA